MWPCVEVEIYQGFGGTYRLYFKDVRKLKCLNFGSLVVGQESTQQADKIKHYNVNINCIATSDAKYCAQ